MTLDEHRQQQAEMAARVQAQIAAERRQHDAEVAAELRMLDAASGR